MNKRKSSQTKLPMEIEQDRVGPAPKLGPDIKAKIGQQLRALYSDVVSQGVPERFVAILNKLDSQEAKAADSVGHAPAGKSHDGRGAKLTEVEQASHLAASTDGSQNEPS